LIFINADSLSPLKSSSPFSFKDENPAQETLKGNSFDKKGKFILESR
jgi:hypothetical protein